MKNRSLLLVTLVIAITLTAFWSHSSDEQPSPKDITANVAPATKMEIRSQTAAAEISHNTITKPKKNTRQENAKPAEEELWDETAIEQLREARLHGDDRAPPIVHEAIIEQRATPEELASPEQYNAYEAREEMKLKVRFVSAAQPRLMELQQQIQAMRDAGLDKEAIREAEEKLVQLNAMNQQLQMQHPEISQQSSNPNTNIPQQP